MRDDMAKIIVERPRHNSRAKAHTKGSRRRLQGVAVEDWPLRESMRMTDKSLNENLAPLRRFLHKQAGRPWNKVHAELCERMDFSNAVQAHVWQHVEDFVCLHPIVQDGLLLSHRGGPMHQQLYVDPRTGLVRRNPRPGYRYWWLDRPEPTTASLPEAGPVINDRTRAIAIGGVWFEVELASLPIPTVGIYDVAFRCPIDEVDAWKRQRVYGNVSVYALRKRQMNSRKIEQIVKPRHDRPLPSFVRNRRRRKR